MQQSRRPLGIANRYRGPRPRRGDIRKLLDYVLDAEGESRGISVAFVGKRTMRRLHRDWMGDDVVTDVMAFPLGSESSNPVPDETPAGEVVICVPVCETSAEERALPLHDEIAKMLIHGALHVLGYDHATSAQRKRMKLRERRYLAWCRRNRLEVMEAR